MRGDDVHNTREHGSAQTRHKLRKRQYISFQTVRAISTFTANDSVLNAVEARRKAALPAINVNSDYQKSNLFDLVTLLFKMYLLAD